MANTNKKGGRGKDYYARQVFVTKANKARREARRKRKVNSPAAKRRAEARAIRHMERREANLNRRVKQPGKVSPAPAPVGGAA